MKDIYLISGLGADRRAFNFLDLKDYNLHHIEWIQPIPGETIESYAQRLLKQIPTTTPTVIGLSFGGILAIEIGKLIQTEKIILLSSVKTKHDLPFYYKIIGKLGLNKWISLAFIKKAERILFWFFGIKEEKEKHMLESFINEANDNFVKWAVDKVVNWKNVVITKNTTLINGTSDRIFPTSKADFKIQHGGHLMVISRAKEVSELLLNVLSK